jgi:hypothetical protein
MAERADLMIIEALAIPAVAHDVLRVAVVGRAEEVAELVGEGKRARRRRARMF